MGYRSMILSASALLALFAGQVSATMYYPYTVETWPALLLQTSPSYYPYHPYPQPPTPYRSYQPSSSSGYQCLYRNAQGECMIEQYFTPNFRPSAPTYSSRDLEEECDRSNRFEDDDDFYDCSYFEDDDDFYDYDDGYEAIDDDDFYNDDDDDFFDDDDDFFDDDDDSSNDDDDDSSNDDDDDD